MPKLKNLQALLTNIGKTDLAQDVASHLDNVSSLLFDEASYLYTHADVEAAVVDQSFKSGFQHWFTSGAEEARLGSGLSLYRNRQQRLRPFNDRPRIAFFGPISAKSGLGSAARGYCAALAEIDLDLEVIDSTACLHSQPTSGTIAAPTIKPDIVIIHHNADALPNFFRLVDLKLIDDAHVIGIWVWELTAFRSEWIEHFGAVDEIWCPSRFAADAVKAMAPEHVSVHVVPHVVEQPPAPGHDTDEAPAHYDRRHFGIPSDAYAFLYVFDVSSAMERKNPVALIESFKDTFGDDPSTVLVMKFHSGWADLEAVAAMKNRRTGSNVIFIDMLFNSDETNSLKQVCDAFVSPHCSEGFGINIAEAMLLGKPVIATNYSGNTDFVNESTGWPIACTLKEVAIGNGHYPKGYIWGSPDRDNLSLLLRTVRNGGKDVERRAITGRKEIEARFSRSAIQSIMTERLTALISAERRESISAFSSRLTRAWRNPCALTTPTYATELRQFAWRPVISVIVPVYNIERAWLEACVESVLAQSYPFWELCLCDDASTSAETLETLRRFQGHDQRIRVIRLDKNRGISGCSNAAVEYATGEYIAFLDNDDTIDPDALRYFVEAIIRDQDADLLYCDEDKIDFEGRYVDHYFKPDWSPEHLESCMYILHMLVVRKSLFLELGGYRSRYTGAQDYDLALRLSAAGAKIVHVPHVLYHWRMIPGSASAQVDAKPQALLNAKSALEEYAIKKYGPDAYVEDGQLFGLFRVRHGKHLTPPVTLVITTNNVAKEFPGYGRINFPLNFLKSIIELTDYPNYRVLMASNGELDEEARILLKSIGGKEIIYTGPSSPFNFADKANFAIPSAETEIVVLLNDDMEVRSPGWLQALVDALQNNQVGAVGARLFYPSGQLQHAGVVLGVNRTAAHVYHGHDGNTVGYNGYVRVIRNYSAVTGACMATRLSLFEAVGGFDPQFATDFNDTDYCLKLRKLGYRIVYTPFCELTHFESQTAVRTSQNPKEIEMFLDRWSDVIAADPYYNPNLSRTSITFDPSPDVWPARR